MIIVVLFVADNSQRYVVTTRSHSTRQVRETLNLLKEKNLISDIEFVGGAGFKVCLSQKERISLKKFLFVCPLFDSLKCLPGLIN